MFVKKWIFLLFTGVLCVMQLDASDFRVFPVPSESKWTGRNTPLFSGLELQVPSGLLALPELPKASGGMKVIIKQAENSNTNNSEAYRLTITDQQVIINSSCPRGTLYALHTLKQLLKKQGNRWSLPVGRIKDMPANKIRAVLIGLRGVTASPEGVKMLKRNFAMLSALKFNTIYLDVGEFANIYKSSRLQFPSRHKYAFSAKQMRELLDFARSWQLRIVPTGQIVSHGGWVMGNHANQSLLENPSDKSWNTIWCWRNPETKKFAYDFLKESIDFFKADEFHVMLDEILFGPFGTCPRCKGTPKAKLMEEIITDLHSFLSKRKVRMTVFHDAFLTGEKTFLNEKCSANKLTLKMPKDILVNIWYYGDYKRLIDNQYNYYKTPGYKLLGSSFLYPSNIETFAKRYRNESGCMATYWFAMNPWGWVDFNKINSTGMAITAWSAGYYWNPDVKLHGAVNFEPTWTVAKHLSKTLPPKLIPGKSLPLPVNRQIASRIDSWPGRVGNEILPKIPAKISTPTGVFNYAGVAAVSGSNKDKLPETVEIAVNNKAKWISFLHTADIPSNNSSLYGQGGFFKEPRIGCYIVKYSDGNTEEIPLLFRRNIVDWNSRLDGALERRGFSAMNAKRLNFRLGLFSWRNPRPKVPIKSIILRGERKLNSSPACAGILLHH